MDSMIKKNLYHLTIIILTGIIKFGVVGVYINTCLAYEETSTLLQLIASFSNDFNKMIVLDNNGNQLVGCISDKMGKHNCTLTGVENFKLEKDNFGLCYLSLSIVKSTDLNLNGTYLLTIDGRVSSVNVDPNKGLKDIIQMELYADFKSNESMVFLTCSTCWNLRFNTAEYVVEHENRSESYGVSYISETKLCECKSETCKCSDSGKTFELKLPIGKTNTIYSCYMYFNAKNERIDKKQSVIYEKGTTTQSITNTFTTTPNVNKKGTGMMQRGIGCGGSWGLKVVMDWRTDGTTCTQNPIPTAPLAEKYILGPLIMFGLFLGCAVAIIIYVFKKDAKKIRGDLERTDTTSCKDHVVTYAAQGAADATTENERALTCDCKEQEDNKCHVEVVNEQCKSLIDQNNE